VVHGLEVPHALAGSGIEADEAFGEKVAAFAMPAEIVVGGRAEGKIDVAQLVSALIIDQTFVFRCKPGIAPQVSLPNSLPAGWNHLSWLVRTS
jgi:hypothetical protein